ncbi:unnamed protein product [Clonostachys rosea f. rosea IK726]|uniref:Uncharacterized protein n=2 Tax=Bionectria ochroleuca TaxID=29856 RepID=A0A0B7K648_BIOOC|nr:unnamed protein product [Clonostachys rosea f. rosea IK726]
MALALIPQFVKQSSRDVYFPNNPSICICIGTPEHDLWMNSAGRKPNISFHAFRLTAPKRGPQRDL